MKTYYVTIDNEGYINGWSVSKEKNTVEIQAEKSLFGKLFCVKVDKNQAILDQAKWDELQKEKPPISELEQVQANLADTSFSLMQEQSNRKELDEQVAALTFQLMEMQGGDIK